MEEKKQKKRFPAGCSDGGGDRDDRPRGPRAQASRPDACAEQDAREVRVQHVRASEARAVRSCVSRP